MTNLNRLSQKNKFFISFILYSFAFSLDWLSTYIGIDLLHYTEANPTVASLLFYGFIFAITVQYVIRGLIMLITYKLDFRAGVVMCLLFTIIQVEAFIGNVIIILS